jgi:transposase-like protein
MGISYRRHRFPPVVIQHAVWVYLRFTLSYRDIEDLLAERVSLKDAGVPSF